MAKLKIILASASPRRQSLLKLAGIEFFTHISDASEEYDDSLAPEEIAMQIAEKKGLAVVNFYQKDHLIIAADTIVYCKGEILVKPENSDEAHDMLHKISGCSHQVITGIYLTDGVTRKRFAEVTEVCFSKLSAEQIKFYVAQYAPFDKAGGYAIQEYIGVIGIEKINGCYYNVMGLPVNRLLKEIQDFL